MHDTLQIIDVFIRVTIFVTSWHESGLWFVTAKSGKGQARTSHDPAAGVQIPHWRANDSVI